MLKVYKIGKWEKVLRSFFAIAAIVTAFSAQAQNPQLDLGEILVLSMDAPVAAVVVGDPKILDVAVEGERTVLVFGKSAGASDVVMLNAEHEVVYSQRFTVDGSNEPLPVADQRPVAADPPTVTVRGPTEQGMAEVRWVCGAGQRCKKGAAE